MTVSFVASGVGVLTPPAGEPADGDWFDYRKELGPRGYKYLPDASKYLLAATKHALADAGDSLAGVDPEQRGAVVGTNSGASALHGAMDRTVLETDADDISPALAPYFSINLLGGRAAIEHQVTGFNLTLTSPRVAGFEAVQHSIRSARLGRASWLVACSVETALDQPEPGVDNSETGAAVVVLEREDALTRRGGRSYGRFQAWTAFLPPSQADPARAADLVRAAYRTFGQQAGATFPMRAVLDDSAVGSAFASALADVAPDGSVLRRTAGAGCLEPMVQVVHALREPSDRETGGVLVLTAAAEGNVGFALITR
ncbi:MAG TPA: beta-ketoacyl synthase N-terminal-like domain-containing protein [Pseudonocardiaceae bacterium]|jgi:3-oxoacyl-[acyl-carrier-protein] synthase II